MISILIDIKLSSMEWSKQLTNKLICIIQIIYVLNVFESLNEFDKSINFRGTIVHIFWHFSGLVNNVLKRTRGDMQNWGYDEKN